MGLFDYIDPRNIGSSLGGWLSERADAAAADPSTVPVLGPAFAKGLAAEQEHMGNPQPKQVDAPTAPAAAMSGDLGALLPQPAAGAGGMGAPGANPLAGLSPAQLMQPVVVGRTGSSSRSVQKRSGKKSMPGFDARMQFHQQQQEQAIKQQGDAEVDRAKMESLALNRHESALRAHQLKYEAQQRELDAKIAAQETRAAEIRAEAAAAQPDPDRWWSSRSAGQRAALGLAAVASGFVQGYYGQAGPNAVIADINQMIDKDVALQIKAIDRKDKQAATEYGILRDLYARTGELRSSALFTRQMLTEGLKVKMDQAAATARAPLARARAQQLSNALGQQVLALRNQAFQESQDTVVETRQSGGSTTTAPLAKVLAPLLRAQKGKEAKPPSAEIRGKATAFNALRRDLVHIDKAFRAGIRPGLSSWAGNRGHAVKQAIKRVVDKYMAAVVPGGGSTEHLKMFENMLGNKWASYSDWQEHLKMLMPEVNGAETAMFEAEAPYFNVEPLVRNAVRGRQLTRHLAGGH